MSGWVLGAMVSLVESDVAHEERRLLEAALYDGLEVRRTGGAICPTDWKSVVRAVLFARRTGSPSYALYELPDGLEVRRTGGAIWPTDWKSVVRAVLFARRTGSPSYALCDLPDGLEVRRTGCRTPCSENIDKLTTLDRFRRCAGHRLRLQCWQLNTGSTTLVAQYGQRDWAVQKGRYATRTEIETRSSMRPCAHRKRPAARGLVPGYGSRLG